MTENFAAGPLSFAAVLKPDVDQADAAFITVGAPQRRGGSLQNSIDVMAQGKRLDEIANASKQTSR